MSDQDQVADGEKLNEKQLSGPRTTVREYLAGRWRLFVIEVIGDRAKVGPLTGWLLFTLLTLIIFLTLVYAPGAFERGRQALGADPSGVITVQAGYFTVAVMTLVGLFVGLEPYLSSVWQRLSPSPGGRQSWLRRILTRTIGAALIAIWRAPGIIFSFLDWLLVRILAPLVGTTQTNTVIRYV